MDKLQIDEVTSVDSQLQILRNAIEFLELRHPNIERAQRLRDQKLAQIRQIVLEGLSQQS